MGREMGREGGGREDEKRRMEEGASEEIRAWTSVAHSCAPETKLPTIPMRPRYSTTE